MSKQPETLQLLKHMEDEWPEDWDQKRIKSELRRLHEVNVDLLEALQLAYLHLTNPMAVQMTRVDIANKALAAITKATGQA